MVGLREQLYEKVEWSGVRMLRGDPKAVKRQVDSTKRPRGMDTTQGTGGTEADTGVAGATHAPHLCVSKGAAQSLHHHREALLG